MANSTLLLFVDRVLYRYETCLHAGPTIRYAIETVTSHTITHENESLAHFHRQHHLDSIDFLSYKN